VPSRLVTLSKACYTISCGRLQFTMNGFCYSLGKFMNDCRTENKSGRRLKRMQPTGKPVANCTLTLDDCTIKNVLWSFKQSQLKLTTVSLRQPKNCISRHRVRSRTISYCIVCRHILDICEVSQSWGHKAPLSTYCGANLL
jgi:hypothetical protein